MLNSSNANDDEIPSRFKDMVGKTNIPVSSPLSVRIALKKLGLHCTFDSFHVEYYISGAALGSNKRLVVDDAMYRRLAEMIHLEHEFSPQYQHVDQGVKRACEANAFHPIKDYLERLKWDKQPRLEKWFATYLGAKDTPFNSEVGRIALVASVARIYDPGAKFDYITVLESAEGYNKSEALRLLYGDENFCDQSILGMEPKQVEETLRGMWGVECSEIAGMRKGDLDKIKAQLSRRKDRVRRVWDKMMTSASRTAILWGTTNNQDYLRAQSGENRRFFPVAVGRIDLAALARDRDQLWAEAWEQFQYDSRGFMLPEFLPDGTRLWDQARAERVIRTQTDPWADLLIDAPRLARAQEETRQAQLARKQSVGPAIYKRTDTEERLASPYLIESVLNIPAERRTSEHDTRVRRIMHDLGWFGPKVVKLGGRTVRAYVRPLQAAGDDEPDVTAADDVAAVPPDTFPDVRQEMAQVDDSDFA